jgi:hypothetical protein
MADGIGSTCASIGGDQIATRILAIGTQGCGLPRDTGGEQTLTASRTKSTRAPSGFDYSGAQVAAAIFKAPDIAGWVGLRDLPVQRLIGDGRSSRARRLTAS